MLGWLKRVAAPVFAVALLGMAPAAMAAPVTFTVGSSFTNAGSDTIVGAGGLPFNAPGGGTVNLPAGTIVSGDDQIAVQFVANPLVPGGVFNVNEPALVTLGELVLNTDVLAADPSSGFDAGSTFNLAFTFNSPVGGLPGLTSSTISGSILFSAPGGFPENNGTLTIDFAPNPIFINTAGGVFRVDLADVVLQVQTGSPNDDSVTIRARVSAVPLPGVAWAGIALLSGFGGARGLKRFRRNGDVA